MKMPSLSHKAVHSNRASSPSPHLFVADSRSALWTRSSTEDVSLSQLHKFWSGLSSTARRELLRIDKQALFEQVRKNLYCSRCHGLLVEGYAQIVSYGKHLQAGLLGYGSAPVACSKHLSDVVSNGTNSSWQDDTRDPSVHPWGGLAATRDSMLTVLDCFLDGTPLEVFESARARERERELLYPDACGGGGRGWISQSSVSFGGNGRGHGMKETCALHTARLSCEALVDFWSALGEETRRSLLRMKEEDFIERLMFRFDSKRFCRDCRRNVLREFKEMKELKRTRKEPRCTRWFCAADTAFRYEVSDSVVQLDWRDCFTGDVGSVYQRFEWSLGTAEGKADILGFEDVGLSESVQVEGLDLGSTSDCFLTIRGWKRDGRCTELYAKAHALKGQLCVHRRLIVGDGFVSITKGESIQRFFERAEETEEEEDDESMDKDGNELDSEGSRPQKHAKSPELARDFLLDAATVIFKEQVEKAFREGTARQNAHSIFVCLALSLLEERVRVACKEITTLEKQNKLLEEEEDEKREEEERRERRKLKEKEKKLRRKEKLKGKVREKDKIKIENTFSKTNSNGFVSGVSILEEEHARSSCDHQDTVLRSTDIVSARPPSPDMAEARPSAEGIGFDPQGQCLDSSSCAHDIEDTLSSRDGNGAFIVERTKSSKRRSSRQGQASDTSPNGVLRRAAIESGGCRNPARVAPVPVSILESSSLQERIISTIQVHSKNNCHRIEPDVVSKRVDGWHQTSGHVQSRHEDFQQCACGGPQTSLRMKGGQKTSGRVGGKDFAVNRVGERVQQHGVTAFSKNGNNEVCYIQENGSRAKVTSTTAKRKGEREHEKTDCDPLEVSRQVLTQNGSASWSTVSAHCILPVDNGAAGKGACVTNTSSATGPLAGRPALGERAFSNGNVKGILIRSTSRARYPGLVLTGKPSGAVGLSDPTALDLQPVGGSSDQGLVQKSAYGGQANLTPGSSAAFKVVPTSSVAVKVSGIQGEDSAVADSMMTCKVSDHVGVCNDSMTVGRLKIADGHGGMFVDPVKIIQALVPSDAQEPQALTEPAFSVSLGAGFQNQTSSALQSIMHSCGHLGAQVHLSSKEMPSQTPASHTLHTPNMVSTQLHLHTQPTVGLYQSWGPRNGVLPLPQPGYLMPGAVGIGLPMGGVPPLALPQSVSASSAGCLSSLPNGLNPLQLRESMFLSKFGVQPSGLTAAPISHTSPPPEREPSPDMLPVDSFSTLETTVVLPISLPASQKDGSAPDGLSQTDASGFSLFHFGGPTVVAQKDIDTPTLIIPLKENSVPDIKGLDCSSDMSRCGCIDEKTGGNACAPGEYSLFATPGKGLVFF